jgi:outer membrane protein assembly factor BamE (lipoprotein component of BamABCDE complex)
MRIDSGLRKFLFVAGLAFGLAGCMSAQQHSASVNDATTGNMTVGTVQRSIHVGMSGSEVASVLGAPNVVTTDEQRREVWIYDKVSSQTVYSTSSGGVAALFFGGYSENAGAISSTQKSLTVIVKYDEQGKVRDFAYHSSQF